MVPEKTLVKRLAYLVNAQQRPAWLIIRVNSMKHDQGKYNFHYSMTLIKRYSHTTLLNMQDNYTFYMCISILYEIVVT